MNKKISVLMPYEIPCLDQDVNIDSIEQELNNHIKTIITNINIQDLEEWKLLIAITSRSTSGIGVFKRIKRYTSDKEFEISISIPIPNDKQASYGLSKVNDAFYIALDDEKFYTLEPNFDNHETLSQYLYVSSKAAINLAFTYGFMCNGKKIKFKKKNC